MFRDPTHTQTAPPPTAPGAAHPPTTTESFIEGVFLSPRVVDRGATERFEQIRRDAETARDDLGQSLRQSGDLAREMADKQATLRAALEESVRLCEAA